MDDVCQMKELATILEISSQALKGMLFDLFHKSSTAVLKLETAETIKLHTKVPHKYRREYP